jgi:hypothetical protein
MRDEKAMVNAAMMNDELEGSLAFIHHCGIPPSAFPFIPYPSSLV